MPDALPAVHVVDDDESYRRSTARLLKSAGFQVFKSASADEFLAGSGERRGCVLLDVHMPGTSGVELQARLAQAGSTLPLVFVTADTDERLRRRALEAGLLAYLGKPAPSDRLLSLLHQALSS